MAHSADLSFAWDANTEPDLEGYRLFYREEGQNYDYVNRAWDGSETTCTIYGLDDNTTYYFVARAYNVYGDESEDSVEVCYKRDGIYIERLGPKSCDPGNAVRIIGRGFGDGIVGDGTPAETKSVVHIGRKEFEYDHPRIKLWTDTKIRIRVPKNKYTKDSCGWFKGADSRTQKVWVTVGGLDSNKKKLKLIKNPADCQ
jgi:hypothetical protein